MEKNILVREENGLFNIYNEGQLEMTYNLNEFAEAMAEGEFDEFFDEAMEAVMNSENRGEMLDALMNAGVYCATFFEEIEY